MPSAYEILKGALVDAGFNDGRHFKNSEAREVVISLFEERGCADPHAKVSDRLRKGIQMGDLIRVKKGVYKFAKPDNSKKPLFYKHRPGRPLTTHRVKRRMRAEPGESTPGVLSLWPMPNPQPNPTEWVLQEEWIDV
tara:strand:+ start:144 stop:554 length:411 start_codon:yes stop_codon:yes gene_type:complete